MTVTCDFLDRLGLGLEADARAIRRAYARELKSIDQERDPDGFQRLRQCYEAALERAAWEERRTQAPEEAQVAQKDAAPTQAAPQELGLDAGLPGCSTPETEVTEPSPFELGRQVFGECCSGMAALVTAGGGRTGLPWLKALSRALGDERLVNLDARLGFELHVAWLLADGWRPGHETLLPAAARIFGWQRDRRGLCRLGEAGPRLDAAIEQGLGFKAQDVRIRTRQREILALLRQPEPPDDERILRDMPVLDQMVRCFPQWMLLIVPGDNVEFWRRRYGEKKGRAFEVNEPPPTPKRKPSAVNAVLWITVSLFLISLLEQFLHHP